MTYCWVIVEAPCTLPPWALLKAARRMPLGSMPLLVQKVRSSAAITASWRFCGICFSEMDSRFWVAKVPIGVSPSA